MSLPRARRVSSRIDRIVLVYTVLFLCAKKRPFLKAPPLLLPQQGRRGTENAFPRHVASRNRARDAAPRLPVRGILPSLPFTTRHVFFVLRRRRREENCFVESVLKARVKPGGGKTPPRLAVKERGKGTGKNACAFRKSKKRTSSLSGCPYLPFDEARRSFRGARRGRRGPFSVL